MVIQRGLSGSSGGRLMGKDVVRTPGFPETLGTHTGGGRASEDTGQKILMGITLEPTGCLGFGASAKRTAGCQG